MVHKTPASKKWFIRGGVLAAVGVALAGVSLPAAAAGGPSLGAARSFGVLGASDVSNTGNTVVTGDVGVSPGTGIIGFPPGIVTGGAIHAADTLAAAAHADATTAYGILAGMASLPANNKSNVDLGGLTLAPGVYKFDGAAQLTGALVLDAGGDSGALFVFQIASALTTAGGSTVTVINGGADYDESNVFWQVGSSATLDTGTAFTGNILALASITLVTGSSVVGNLLALNGSVVLDSNSVTSPVVVVVPPGGIEPPDGLIVSLSGSAGSQSADLSFTDGSDNETEFRVYRRDGVMQPFVLVETIVATDTVGTVVVVTTQDALLAPATNFSYRVTAYNAVDGESSPSNMVQVQTTSVLPTGRPSGARTILSPPVGGPDQDAIGRLFVKHFPSNRSRAERSWFKLKLRHLDGATEYTLWADDPTTAGTEFVQFDSFTTRNNGNFNYTRDTKKGSALTFGATLTSFGGKPIEVRNAAGTVVVLSGFIPATNP
jgi:hypothetical protein